MYSQTQPLVSYCSERKKASLASSTCEKDRRKKIMCSYCNKSEHKKAQYWKKPHNSKQSKETRRNAIRVLVALMWKSSTNQQQVKYKKLVPWQWLVVALTNQEIQVFVDTASDLTLIWKDNSVYLRFKLFFSAKAGT